MVTRTFIKGRRSNYDAPAYIGMRIVRSVIPKRLCKNCKFYIKSEKYCPMIVGKVDEPNADYCSWFDGKVK